MRMRGEEEEVLWWRDCLGFKPEQTLLCLLSAACRPSESELNLQLWVLSLDGSRGFTLLLLLPLLIRCSHHRNFIRWPLSCWATWAQCGDYKVWSHFYRLHLFISTSATTHWITQTRVLFMSLELLTQRSSASRLDFSFFLLFFFFFLTTSLLLTPSSRCGPCLCHMANSSAVVYLNLTLKFTLPRRYLNKVCHLLYASEALH